MILHFSISVDILKSHHFEFSLWTDRELCSMGPDVPCLRGPQARGPRLGISPIPILGERSSKLRKWEEKIRRENPEKWKLYKYIRVSRSKSWQNYRDTFENPRNSIQLKMEIRFWKMETLGPLDISLLYVYVYFIILLIFIRRMLYYTAVSE